MGFKDSFQIGVRSTLGFGASALIFGFLFGAAAVTDRLSTEQVILMSGIVYAAGAQIAVLDLWQEPLPFLALAVSTALICSRHILLGLALEKKVPLTSWRDRLTILPLLTDAAAILTLRTEKPLDARAHFIGSGLTMYTSWMIGTAAGVFFFTLMNAETIRALAFAGTLFLGLLVALVARGNKAAILPLIVTGATAILLTELGLSGLSNLILAILAGTLALFIRKGIRHA